MKQYYSIAGKLQATITDKNGKRLTIAVPNGKSVPESVIKSWSADKIKILLNKGLISSSLDAPDKDIVKELKTSSKEVKKQNKMITKLQKALGGLQKKCATLEDEKQMLELKLEKALQKRDDAEKSAMTKEK